MNQSSLLTKRMRDKVFRKGDVVVATKPEEFVRCGYNMTLKDGIEAIHNDADIMKKVFDLCPKNSYAVKDIVTILAKDYVRRNGFGGKERRVHTKPSNVLNKLYVVTDVSTVVTGTYCPGYSYAGSYWDEPEYEPNGLSDAEAHRILDVTEINMKNSGLSFSNLKIQASSCEKIIPLSVLTNKQSLFGSKSYVMKYVDGKEPAAADIYARAVSKPFCQGIFGSSYGSFNESTLTIFCMSETATNLISMAYVKILEDIGNDILIKTDEYDISCEKDIDDITKRFFTYFMQDYTPGWREILRERIDAARVYIEMMPDDTRAE